MSRMAAVHIANESRTDGRIQGNRPWVVRLLALCCLGLVPWTIGMAVTLPRNYLVANWPLAWTGFDVLLLGCLSTTAWALWKQRQVALPASMITSVLLFCDAWFDVLTAHGGRCLTVSIATAIFAEIPLALLLSLICVRLLHATARAARQPGPDAACQSMWRMPLVPSGRSTSWLMPAPSDGGRNRIGAERVRLAVPQHVR